MTKKETIPEGLKLLNEWTQRLGLQDWKMILFDNVDPKDLPIGEACATCEYSESTKEAVIKIADPNKIEMVARKWDYEETLVHELLHCKLALLDEPEKEAKETLQSRFVHVLIDDIARALVDAKRYEKGEIT